MSWFNGKNETWEKRNERMDFYKHTRKKPGDPITDRIHFLGRRRRTFFG